MISSLHDILVILLSTPVRERLRITSFLCLLLLIETEGSIVISKLCSSQGWSCDQALLVRCRQKALVKLSVKLMTGTDLVGSGDFCFLSLYLCSFLSVV